LNPLHPDGQDVQLLPHETDRKHMIDGTAVSAACDPATTMEGHTVKNQK
jgi:hypothetical protein